ncbi:MAG TPA: hypothetical protein VNM46_16055 [Xanthobacteraceae bacterium]|nr:hypothetical protein [Xanthobacteraceae bacterium]
MSPTTSMRGDMKAMVAAAAALFTLSAHNSLSAQVFCASGQAQVDSARDELISVLGNDSQLAKEIRQEQKIASANDLAKMTLVRDRAVCSRVASRIDHPLPVGAAVVVLSVGPLYYVREPDQKKGTGVITDRDFKVVARLGAAVDGVTQTGRPPER